MAVSHGRNLYFAVSTPSGGAMASISSDTKEVDGLPGEQDMGDTTVAGQVGYSQYPGLQKASFSTVHVFNDAAGGSWAKFGAFQSLQQTYPTTAWGIQFGPKGTTAGYPLMTCNAFIRSAPLSVKVTDVNLFTVSWEMSAGTTGITVGVFS